MSDGIEVNTDCIVFDSDSGGWAIYLNDGGRFDLYESAATLVEATELLLKGVLSVQKNELERMQDLLTADEDAFREGAQRLRFRRIQLAERIETAENPVFFQEFRP